MRNAGAGVSVIQEYVNPAQRIHAVLAFQALLLSESCMNIDPESLVEFRELHSFDRVPTRRVIERIKSVLRSYALEFGEGIVTQNSGIIGEVDQLIAYCDSLIPPHTIALKRSPIIKKKLGSVFIRRGFGCPLFGYLRPATPPVSGGVLLCYQSSEADGTGSILAAPMDGSLDITYEGLGVRITGKTRWARLHMECKGRFLDHSDESSSDRRAEQVFESENYTIRIANSRGHVPTPFSVSPLYYNYPYYFSATENMANNIRKYIGGVLSGMYGCTSETANTCASSFIQILL